MTKIINIEDQIEYDKFLNLQFKILRGHFNRCMTRAQNKFFELAENEAR